MCRFVLSLDIDQELGCMVLWKEPRDDFFGHFLGCEERCDRLAAAGGLESPIWLCYMIRLVKKEGAP